MGRFLKEPSRSTTDRNRIVNFGMLDFHYMLQLTLQRLFKKFSQRCSKQKGCRVKSASIFNNDEDGWIGQSASIAWSSRSPDLNPKITLTGLFK